MPNPFEILHSLHGMEMVEQPVDKMVVGIPLELSKAYTILRKKAHPFFKHLEHP